MTNANKLSTHSGHVVDLVRSTWVNFVEEQFSASALYLDLIE
jgi:hypothetical protein